MHETQRYKISYETKVAAQLALAARISHCRATLQRADIGTMLDYWQHELEIARAALNELDAL